MTQTVVMDHDTAGEAPQAILVAVNPTNSETWSYDALLAIVTETIFSWPGIGRLTVQAISNRDYYLVQGCILAIGLTYIAVNLLTDILYNAANPRIRQ